MPPSSSSPQQLTTPNSFFCQKDHYILTYRPVDGNGSQWLIKYDSQHRTPKWCLSYHPPKGSSNGAQAVRAKASFHADQRIDLEQFRVRPNDYLHSGFDRGHMVPAADFSATQEALQSTFTMANMVPQSPLLNKGFWAKLEGLIRYIHERHDEFGEMVVITGPVYAPVKFGNNWMYMHKVRHSCSSAASHCVASKLTLRFPSSLPAAIIIHTPRPLPTHTRIHTPHPYPPLAPTHTRLSALSPDSFKFPHISSRS